MVSLMGRCDTTAAKMHSHQLKHLNVKYLEVNNAVLNFMKYLMLLYHMGFGLHSNGLCLSYKRNTYYRIRIDKTRMLW